MFLCLSYALMSKKILCGSHEGVIFSKSLVEIRLIRVLLFYKVDSSMVTSGLIQLLEALLEQGVELL